MYTYVYIHIYIYIYMYKYIYILPWTHSHNTEEAIEAPRLEQSSHATSHSA